jgi:hypothetical protein
VATATQKVETAKAVEKPKTTQKAKVETTEPAEEAKTTQKAKVETTEPAEEAKTVLSNITMDDIAITCLALIKKNRPALVALLAKFGVKKASELGVELFPDFKAALDKELSGNDDETLV